MPAKSPIVAFRILWWTLGLGLFVLSVTTVIGATAGPHPDLHALLIGGLEAISAILFLIPKTLRVGATGLLITLFIAFAIHGIALKHFRWDLLIYGAAVYFVASHGASGEGTGETATLHG